MGRIKKLHKFRKELHKEYHKEMAQYWKLPLKSRITLAINIIFKVRK